MSPTPCSSAPAAAKRRRIPRAWAPLKQAIRDWDLFLAFCLIDGSTPGKGHSR